MLYTAVFAIYLPQQGYNLPSLELIPQPFSCKRTLLPTEIELLSNNERQKLEEMMMRKKNWDTYLLKNTRLFVQAVNLKKSESKTRDGSVRY